MWRKIKDSRFLSLYTHSYLQSLTAELSDLAYSPDYCMLPHVVQFLRKFAVFWLRILTSVFETPQKVSVGILR